MPLPCSIYFVFWTLWALGSHAKITFSTGTTTNINQNELDKATAAISLLAGTVPMVALWGDFENLTEAVHTCWETKYIEGGESRLEHRLFFRNRDRTNDAGNRYWPSEFFEVHYGMTIYNGKAEILVTFLNGSIPAKAAMDESSLQASQRLLGQWEKTAGASWDVLQANQKCFVVKLPKFCAPCEIGKAQCLIWVPKNIAEEYMPNKKDFATTTDGSLRSCLSEYNNNCAPGEHMLAKVSHICLS
uniref:Putative secreted protein n=1 Tax=Amblyomma triste TaxID=251400 RepID=A0A023G5T6_AMBTT